MNDIIDVAIVGGGMSGLYTGWRIMKADPQRSRVLGNLAQAGKLNVHIFEMSNRVGGRLLSLTPPGMPDFKAEFAGMRYLSNQRLVRNLVDKLDLGVRPFPVGSNKNIYYLRGHHLREQEFQVQERMLQPLDDWQVYVCGEAYSGSQGWVQGALETAEKLLDDKFDLQTPGWLTLG